MHLVVDAVAVRPGSSGIVVEHLLEGWVAAAPGDRITVLTDATAPPLRVPAGVDVAPLASRLPGPTAAMWLRSGAVRRAARRLGADLVLSGVPASALAGTGCPRGLILYDLRHEYLPHQFSRRTRVARRLSWDWSMRRAEGIHCISERTLQDLVDRHPRHAAHAQAAQLGSDHVDAWPEPAPADPPYALAFGHFANKNADGVLAGWAEFCRSGDVAESWVLRLVGMGAADRAAAQAQVARLGIADRVELMPWLDDEEFRRWFTGASMVVFPSDFEGFGLPAAEALRLGIPTVISTDRALAEVTGGHAITAASGAPADLASAMAAAAVLPDSERDAGRAFAERFTWRRTAATIRAAHADADHLRSAP